MSDELEPQDRAERALRAALEREADGFAPSALAPTRRRRPWLVVAAAAAAVLVLVGGFAVGLPHRHPAPLTDQRELISLRTRWVSYLNVEMKAPANWIDSTGPNGFGCPEAGTPYVDLGSRSIDGGVACVSLADPTSGPTGEQKPPSDFPDLPTSRWRENLELNSGPRVGHLGIVSTNYDGWTMTRRDVGQQTVALFTKDDDISDPRALVASAHVFKGNDTNGCASYSPIEGAGHPSPRPWTIPKHVDAVAACLYSRGLRASSGPSLEGSRRLTGAAAQALVRAIVAAPAGGGPVGRNCSPADRGFEAVALRAFVHDRVIGEFYVYFDACGGNGIDDGTVKHEITAADCAPIFGGRVTLLSGEDNPASRRCNPYGG